MPVQSKIKYVLFFVLLNLITYFSIQALITTNEFDFTTTLDKQIPFVPEFIWAYHTLIPVIGISMVMLLKRRDVFLTTFFAFLLATLVLSLFYIFLPSFYPRTAIVDVNLSTWLVSLTRIIDGPHNTFPSGHVTFSWLIVFAVYGSTYAKKCTWAKTAYTLWAILISISTLTLKQHYIIDVASGFLLAAICYFSIKKILMNRLQRPNYIEATAREELTGHGAGI